MCLSHFYCIRTLFTKEAVQNVYGMFGNKRSRDAQSVPVTLVSNYYNTVHSVRTDEINK